ncbi:MULTISPECIES: hypothetical protein [Bacillota]|uniref:hypothetical protein n=1 Tax=Bacillota TaxID=1239 RepID=UPI00272DD883|nr:MULTISPECIES: hypothetical protein [Bacillota]MDW8565977.1 hypothetical protein [Staphylococcus shinii]MEC5302641.1 hypothetical protein [Staphylococcus shinii]
MTNKFETFFVIITVLFVGLLIFNNFSGINSSALLISILVVYVILLFIRYSIKKKYKENQK